MRKFLLIMAVWLAFMVYIVFRSVTANRGDGDSQSVLNNLQSGSVCSSEPARVELFLSSQLPAVRKLGELEEKCGSQVSSSLMYFTIMPKDSINAQELADKVEKVLQEYHKDGISPIVIVEPDSAWGLVDFSEFSSGFWDPFIDSFFSDLKKGGITDDMMGTWVPFPEANLPYWNHQNTTPEVYAVNVNRYVRILKKYFPNAKASVLLNSATYATDDYNWADGEYVSLKPYVQNLDKTLIDSFGLQGFPWMSPANEKGRVLFDSAEWLSVNLAIEAADTIGTKNIWFNTGTFAAKYASNPEMRTLVPGSVRKEILEKIIKQVRTLKGKKYNVSVNLFAEDKSGTSEGTDWSYFGSEYTNSEDHIIALLDFLKNLHKEGVNVSFFFK